MHLCQLTCRLAGDQSGLNGQTACALSPQVQRGLALPTVLALSMLSSVLLLACWRNISLYQGWSHSSVDRWQLRQAALSALCQVADSIRSTPSPNNAAASTPWPTDAAQWAKLKSRVPANGCVQGMCQPLLQLSNQRSDWSGRQSSGLKLPTSNGINLVYWVEILPTASPASNTVGSLTYRITVLAQAPARSSQTAWQSVWQPAVASSIPMPVRLADMQSVLELPP